MYVRSLTALCRDHALNFPIIPIVAVIFVDEIDSLLTSRTESDVESSRRIKTEFLVQMEGIAQDSSERLLFIGATNRYGGCLYDAVVVVAAATAAATAPPPPPTALTHFRRPQELDNAALRRMPKRLYIPLPDECGRRELLCKLLAKCPNDLSKEDIDEIVTLTDGYSGSDLFHLCREAALFPLRSIGDISKVDSATLRPVNLKDFKVRQNRKKLRVNVAVAHY